MTEQEFEKYNHEYQKKFIRRIVIKFNRKTETDILEWLESQENIQAYIKGLIENDMSK